MRNRIFPCTFILILTLLVSLFQSCKKDDSGLTIWTGTATYSDFQSAFDMSIDNGYYVRMEFTNDQFAEISNYLTNEGRHSWDEATLKKWLISIGFGETEAARESSWFVLINHGGLAVRSGNLIYYVLK